MSAAHEFLRLTQETAYNVFNTSPATGQQIFVSLPQDNSCTVRKAMNIEELVSAGYGGRKVVRLGRSYTVGGKVMTKLRPSQTQLLIGLLVNLTTGNCPDLASFSLDHGFFLDDGNCSPLITRYTGCKMSGTLSGSAGNAESVSVDLDVIGSQALIITDGSVTAPAASAVPEFETPFGFEDSAGLITWGTGTGFGVRTKYTSFSLSIANNLVPYRAETPYASNVDWKGREVSLTIANRYKAPQDRIDYEAIAARAASFGLSYNGNVLAFNMGGNNYIDAPQDDLKMGSSYVQTITIKCYIDHTSGTDITATFTPAPTPPTGS